MAFTPEQAFNRLDEARVRGRLAHAYLVSGPPGSGKEALACRLLGAIRGAPPPATLDAAVDDRVQVLRPRSKSRRIRLEQIHMLEQSLRLTSARGSLKLGVIADADRMNEQSQNAFLKTLEEPPPHCLILLLSPHPEQLLVTILSRCIGIELLPGARVAPAAGSPERALLDLLEGDGVLARRGIRPALRLAREFSLLLQRCESEIKKHYTQVFNEEKARFLKTTGNSEWAEDREEESEAMASSDYLALRGRLLGVLLCWFGDALRLKAGSERLDLPECRAALAKLAAADNTESLLRRLAAIERLGSLMNTNVSENLAVEVAFIRAFS
jgi:DNA polymerase III subunit delta'